MRVTICILVVAILATCLVATAAEQQQQQQKRILRRVIKSTPTATNLGRVRLVAVRATSGTAEKGAVSEISSKEAASFGQRSSNETNTQQQQQATKTKQATSEATQLVPAKPSPSTSASKTASTSTTSTTSTTTPAPTVPTSTSTSTSNSNSNSNSNSTTSTTTTTVSTVPKASERQQVAPEVELLSSAPSSWQMMTAVEAPAAALIAAGTRPAPAFGADLSASSSSSNEFNQADFARSYSSSRRQTGKTRQQQTSFYPQQTQQLRQGKTSSYEATKTQWYKPTTTTTSTTPRPAPIVQEPQYEQYVEQVDSAPPGQAEPFAFDFNTQDTSGNGQYRKEESDNNGVVRGSYGFRDASGLYRHVEYIADHNGFRASIKSNEPGLEGGRDSQPASIKLDSGPAPARFTSSENSEWSSPASSSPGIEKADLALAPSNFESSHKAARVNLKS